ncbi:MAG: hypothetical protein KAV45_00675, partial [Calditrichia bacterium]|nr:hypothetical protein [Calditrichia bacterium]
AFCLIVIPVPHLREESIENKESSGFRVKPGMTKNVILQNSILKRLNFILLKQVFVLHFYGQVMN